MTMWIGVAVAYVIVMSLGLAVGRYLAERFPRGGQGGHSDPTPYPGPTGPSHALQCPPLGSAFDRALLPGAFDGAAAPEHAA